MVTIPGALLLCISSPYSRTGELWKAYRKHYGQDDSNVLVWQASTRQMNPTVPKQLVQDALDEDFASARAEYLAPFRRDVETLISLEALESVKREGERFKLEGKVFYLHAPQGIGRSKLAARVEKSLGVAVTARNWRTVCKIRDMMVEL